VIIALALLSERRRQRGLDEARRRAAAGMGP
jgi:hypothetical protein